MPFQSTVSLQQGFGVVGEMFTDSPHRAQSYILDSVDAADNVFGRAFTKVSQGVAKAGGTGVFAGYLVNPKTAVLQGTVAGGTLAPSLTLPNDAQAEILSMGTIIVELPASAAIGDLIVFDNTTGELETIAPGATLPAGKTFGQAVVDYFTVSGEGLAVITVSPAIKLPVPA